MRHPALLLLSLLAFGALARASPASDLFERAEHRRDQIREIIEDAFDSLRKHHGDDGEGTGRKLLATPGGILDTATTKVQDFLENIIGGNWTHAFPHDWNSTEGFDWSKLGEFEYNSNWANFADSEDLAEWADAVKGKDWHAAGAKLSDIEGYFCTDEKYTPPKEVPTTCTGPQITLAYLPKVCVLNEVDKQVVCDPAKLVLVKTPGSCVHKYHTAGVWKGKECKIQGKLGFNETKVLGGGNFTVSLENLPDKFGEHPLAGLFSHSA